ncbi:TonB-dependent receptor [Luminiphilus syltensis NOR5-1B]|uniref:TonB-dependent receptor n=1 Tax=Luminiphilus syltensis NOR5-1B TaxID=565045 RepID=B8KT93_9GAMM|nr:TonB-dependent receptor [Luminiphilus syltensis]EED35374.1 TonB-dependent receptor [Luminiphilus syltensis NOR5-1B]
MKKRNPLYLATGAALALSLGGGLAQASVLEEVIVTAQKREQNLQDVGVSVTAYSGNQLDALGFDNNVDITQQVPGMQLNTFSPSLTTFNIRGISQNNFTDNLEAPIAVYIDDAYVSSMQAINGQMFDMQRMEVLRGPQGTLFGRNATGGLVHYITNKATDEELNGYVQVEGGDYSRKAVEGAVGGAISDRARYRIAGRWNEMDGYIESKPFPGYDAPLPPPSGVDIGGMDGYSARIALQFDVGDRTLVDVMAKYSEDDGVPTGGYNFLQYGSNADAYIPQEFIDFTTDVIGAPAEATADIFFCESQIDCFAPVNEAGLATFQGDADEPFEHYSDYPGFLDRTIENYTVNIEHEFVSGMQLQSITNYQAIDKFYTEDGDGIPVPIIEFTTVADQTQFSQEFRLSGDSDNFRWQTGLYWLDIEMDNQALTAGSPAFGAANELGFGETAISPAVEQDYQIDATNWSVFGQGEFDVSDRLTVIAGLRWSQDDKEMDFVSNYRDDAAGVFVPNLFNFEEVVDAAGGDQDEIDYGDWAGRLQLDFRVTEDTLLFASYNRGIKGGNWTVSAGVSLDTIRHDEEILDSFEAGFKTQTADGTLRINGTVFYYDYTDYQAFSFNGGTPQIRNSDAESMGGELEVFWTPTENWDFVLGASLLDTEVDEVFGPELQATPVPGVVVDWPVDSISGYELPNAPRYSLNYLARYNMPLGDSSLALQVDGNFNDDQWFEVTNEGGSLQEAYNVTNARITWTTGSEALEIVAWVKNVFDEEYKIYNLNLGILGNTSQYAPPRMVGGQVRYAF